MAPGVKVTGHSRVIKGTPGFEVHTSNDKINIHINDWQIIRGQHVRIGQNDIDADIVLTTRLNPDNSVYYELRGVHWNYYRYRSDNTYDFRFHIIISNINQDGSKRSILDRTYAAKTGTTDIHINSGSDIIRSGVIQPNEARNASVSIELFHLYNDAIGTPWDDEGYGGITIVNTNDPSFRPGMTLDRPSWESDNRNPEGMNLEFRNGRWSEVRSIRPYASSGAQSLFYRNYQWLNQDKVGNGR